MEDISVSDKYYVKKDEAPCLDVLELPIEILTLQSQSFLLKISMTTLNNAEVEQFVQEVFFYSENDKIMIYSIRDKHEYIIYV